MNRSLLKFLWVFLLLVDLPSAPAQESDWPRTLPLKQGTITIYRLQVDEMKDDTLHFRAALAYRETAESEPVFGAGWFESRVEIDQSRGIVHPTDLKVSQTRFPDGTDDMQAELSATLAQESPDWILDFTLDELQAALKTAEAETLAAQKLNTDPPRIIYRDHPALLITMDGDPILREIEDSPFEAVINTPYPLIFDGRQYYLNAAKDVWYRSDQATGPYRFDASPPAEIAALVKAEESESSNAPPTEQVTAANAPEIIVSTEPAELIVTEGPAAFVPLVDDLLVLHNSDDDVFMHVGTQDFYIVLAGRWYTSPSLDGPWTYRSADDLPAAFANIPVDSDQADSRVYVAGTDEAREAVLDAQVPQTAAVERGEVDVDVEYDGEPEFDPVDGTDLEYANNTGSTVIESDGLYYLVEDGVWYVATSPEGPWQVSAHRPRQVDRILPTSPVYNVKYVHIYDSTPQVVYVGYTPGYFGSYVYHNTLFYGTGWHYRPWISPYHYYPRHSTWGFHVGYNSWSGWSFGLSWGWGPFYVGFFPGGYWHHDHYWHHRHHGYWGPRGYWPRHHGYHRYGHRRYAHNDYARGGHNRDRGYRSDHYRRDGNLYRDGAQRARVVNTLDKQARTPIGGAGESRKTKYLAANGDRVQKTSRQGKVSRKQLSQKWVDPVKPSDLRRKADARDVSLKASRTRLLADNGGNVYRKSDRNQDWKAVQRKSIKDDKPSGGRAKKQAEPSHKSKRYIDKTSFRSAEQSTSRRKSSSLAMASSQSSRQKRTVAAPQDMQPIPVPKARVRQTKPRAASYDTTYRSKQVHSAVAQKPYASRPTPYATASSRNGPGYSVRSQAAPKKGAHKSSRARYDSGGHVGASSRRKGK